MARLDPLLNLLWISLCAGLQAPQARQDWPETDGIELDPNWAPMPDGGWIHLSCVHSAEEHGWNGSHVVVSDAAGDVIRFGNGSLIRYPPCPYRRRRSTLKGQPSGERAKGADANLSYYSGWVAYTETTSTAGYTAMVSSWGVPVAPKSRGPAPPLVSSSIYLFNGLEDGGGHHNASLILQPVLSIGRSGCLLDPFKWGEWWLTSFFVSASGRAHCGKNLGPLSEGETVVGKMSLSDPDTNTWVVDSYRPSTNESSVLTAELNMGVTMTAAYLTLEAMVMYSCEAYPSTSNVTFVGNLLETKGAERPRLPEGESDTAATGIEWAPHVNHSECGQKVGVDASNDDVTIFWAP